MSYNIVIDKFMVCACLQCLMMIIRIAVCSVHDSEAQLTLK